MAGTSSVLDHVDFAVQDLALSRAFYLAALAPLGIRPLIETDREDGRQGTGFGSGDLAQFFIGGGRPVTGRLHVAFQRSLARRSMLSTGQRLTRVAATMASP